MSLMRVKCDNCGADIRIDGEKGSGACPYCGAEYFMNSEVRNYNTTIVNNNNINAGNVTIVGANAKNLFRLALDCWQGRDYSGAYNNFTKVLELDPDNEDAALYRCLSLSWKENSTNYVLISNTYHKVFDKTDIGSADEQTLKRMSFFLSELEKLNCATMNSLLQGYDRYNVYGGDIKDIFNELESITGMQSYAVTLMGKLSDRDPEYRSTYIVFMKDLLDFYDVLCDEWRYTECYDDGTHKIKKAYHPDKMAFMKEQKRIFGIIRQYEPDFKYRLKDGCYIATAVYGSYDCPQVWTLRRYRDDVLGKNVFGRLFIRIYYAVSPVLMKLFGKLGCFRNFWRKRLDKMVNKLKSRGFEDTPYKDKNWRKR